jgi:hypothetical protein
MRIPFYALLVGFSAFAANTLACGDLEQDQVAPTETAVPAESSPQISMRVGGVAWIDARPAPDGSEVVAFADTVECGRTTTAVAVDDYQAAFGLDVASTEQVSGCGAPGVTLRFEIEGRAADQTIDWAASGRTRLDLIVGPAFARITGSIDTTNLSIGESILVEPRIDGNVCGAQVFGGTGDGTSAGYIVVIDPQEIRAGCGRPGAVVALHALVQHADGTTSITEEPIASSPWVSGELVELPSADLLTN